MNKLTYLEIKQIIDRLDENEVCSPASWMCGDYPSTKYIESEPDKKLVEMLGNIEIVDDFGGEGCGDDYWAVYYFADHDVYIQFDGWYVSHHGSEYEEMFEVRPVQVTSTQYEAVRT